MMKKFTCSFLRMKSAKSWSAQDLRPREHAMLHGHGDGGCLELSTATWTTHRSRRIGTIFDDSLSTPSTSAFAASISCQGRKCRFILQCIHKPDAPTRLATTEIGDVSLH